MRSARPASTCHNRFFHHHHGHGHNHGHSHAASSDLCLIPAKNLAVLGLADKGVVEVAKQLFPHPISSDPAIER